MTSVEHRSPTDTVAQLRRRLDAVLDELEVLRAAFGQDDRTVLALITHLGLTSQQAKLVGAIYARQTITHEALYGVLCGTRLDVPEPVTLKVTLYHARRKLLRHGVTIDSVRCVGFRLSGPMRARLGRLMAGLPADEADQ
jgi:hypothetical protein